MAKLERYFNISIVFLIFFKILSSQNVYSNILKIENSKISCITPSIPATFFNKTVNPCANVPFQYTFLKVTEAEGYVWSYTGTGAKIKLVSDSESTPLTSLNNEVFYYSNDANDVYIEFEDGFTNGSIVVKSFNFCSLTNQFVYSTELILPIQKDQSVNFTVSNDQIFNCQQSSVILNASCDGVSPSYSWSLIGNPSLTSYTNTITANASDLNTTDYAYVVSINYTFSPKDQCTFTDTIHVIKDIIKPSLSTSSNIYTLNCSILTNNLIGSTSTPFTDLSWRINGNIYGNPKFIDTNITKENTYYLIGTNSVNYCKDSVAVIVDFDFAKPNSPLINNLPYSALNSIGTITCTNPTLIAIPTNVFNETNTFYWNNSSQQQIVFSSSLMSDTLHVIGTNGCLNKFYVFINENKTPPVVTPLADGISSCSTYFTSLTHATNLNPESGWVFVPGTNYVLGSETYSNILPGSYVYKYIDEINGCVSYDTVLINFNNKINVTLTTDDNHVCYGQQVRLNANGYLFTAKLRPNYHWLNGGFSPSYGPIVTQDGYYYVITTASFGGDGSGLTDCYSKDSIYIDVIEPFDIGLTPISSCQGTATNLQVTVGSNAILPIYYQIDGTNQTLGTKIFQGIQPGDHVVTVIDHEGCKYNQNVTINPTTVAPTPYFLASTYNAPTDIVALVNDSDESAFTYDSFTWELPSGLTFAYETDSIRFISASDTGNFIVTLIGHIDNCSYYFTKNIYFGNVNPVSYQLDPNKGIQDLILSPNPNSGVFSSNITFGVEQNFIVYVTDIAGNVIAYKPSVKAITSNDPFDITLHPSGTYILHVISDFDTAHKSFIKN